MVIFKIIVVSDTMVKIKLKGSTGSTSLVYLKALFCVKFLLFTKSYLTFLQGVEDSVLGMCLFFMSLQIFIVDLLFWGRAQRILHLALIGVFVFLNAKLLYCVKSKQHCNKLVFLVLIENLKPEPFKGMLMEFCLFKTAQYISTALKPSRGHCASFSVTSLCWATFFFFNNCIKISTSNFLTACNPFSYIKLLLMRMLMTKVKNRAC